MQTATSTQPHTARVHIVGVPRSGTSLMLQLMTACFRFDDYAAGEQSLLEAPIGQQGTYCSKRPHELALTAALLDHDPDLWVIFVRRDPRDAVVSRHPRRPESYYVGLWLWIAQHATIRRLAGHPRLITVCYEDLVRRPDEVQAQIAARLPFLPVTAPFSRYHEHAHPTEMLRAAMHGLRRVDPGSIGNWRHHKTRLAGQLKLYGPISKALIDLGYEADDAWLAELSGVEPDMTEHRRSRPPSWFKRLKQRIHLARSVRRYRRRLRAATSPGRKPMGPGGQTAGFR